MMRQVFQLTEEQFRAVQRMLLRLRAARAQRRTVEEMLEDALTLIRPHPDAIFDADQMAFILEQPNEEAGDDADG